MGCLEFELLTFDLLDDPDMKLSLYAFMSLETAEKLARGLAATAAENAHP
jgi:hypothetical protein